MTFDDEKKTNEEPTRNVEKQKSSFVVDEEFEQMVQDLAPTSDDPTAPSFTFRVWVIGTVFVVVLGWINMLFTFRTNLFQVSSYVATLLSYPIGVLMAKTFPRWQFHLFGLDIDTNPGPFSVKEHVLIGIFGSTGASGVYATYNLVVQEVYYDMHMNPFWAISFLFASSALGFGISGMTRKFLIRPIHMIWPTVLPTVALYSAFHKVDTAAVKDDGANHYSQLTVFGIGTLGMGLYHLLGPGYLTTMLQNISVLCWIAPKSNTFVQQLGSPVWGVGILAWTGDWTNIGSGAMSVPFWAAANVFAAAVFFHWIATPIMFKNNWFGQPKMPIALNSTRLFTSQSKVFKASDVVDKQSHRMIDAQYAQRAPIHMSPFFAISYFANFTTLPAALIHTCVWYGKDIYQRLRYQRESEEEDIHCKLIDAYPEVPNTWYYGFFVVTAVLMLLTGELSELQFPWWAMLFATALAIITTIPIAVVLATAGVALYVNVISQFLIGLILPGQPIVMMAFKALSVSVSAQCLTLLTDLKLGHYLNQLISCFVVFGAMRQWLATPEHVQWVLDDGKVEGPGKSWGASQSHNVYYSASLIWGAIGPKRFFFDTQYSPVIWVGVIVGCVTPVILKLCHTFIGGSYWALIHPAIILGPGGAGGNQGTTLSYFTVAFFFQFFMYRYRSAWWKRYNYVLATAFDVACALVALLTTFVLPDAPTWFMNCPSGECTFSDKHGPFQDWCFPVAPEA
ncbi:OPT oligopeptide transporter protein-domain-containing protein [Catenaria anguillulae PL171]|uniref:OPT oligopeptide transporter protein-domain-containing protein n=1 Tax=Catenaria anguillulae PL171 TaxID=765915 RepID=A0A1Y2HH37_9FUNG|nr:OPT oligopeptide transporter protein-domain-containing protein [Catenaria anguillulae PL171]